MGRCSGGREDDDIFRQPDRWATGRRAVLDRLDVVRNESVLMSAAAIPPGIGPIQ
jgi:hypothetical protein